MVCPKCGATNRSGARFCKKCGAVLEQVVPSPPPRAVSPPPPPAVPVRAPSAVPPPPPPPVAPRVPPPVPVEARSGGAARVIGGIGLFGGYLLVIVGALATSGAFFLPWFPTGEKVLTGLETVMQAFEAGSDQMFLAWGLVPLGTLGVLLLGLVGLALGFSRRRLSTGLTRVALLLPLLAALSGACACFPFTSPLIAPLMETGFDVNSLSGELAGLGYGFWIALGGAGVSLVGVLIAFIGGLIGRRRVVS
jgi:hypothetical protein